MTSDATAEVPVPEIRDYLLINREVERLLEAGHRRVRLAGVGRQRLLLAGFTGPWSAVIEVEGSAGPELAAEMNAPGLLVVARGDAADGAGRSLWAGRLVILGSATDGVGAGLQGGSLVVAGSVGDRVGLRQRGGALVVLGDAGRLAGDRQAGGLLVVRGSVGPHVSRGKTGGACRHGGAALDASMNDAVAGALEGLEAWIPSASLVGRRDV